jgi:hypothetical protein
MSPNFLKELAKEARSGVVAKHLKVDALFNLVRMERSILACIRKRLWLTELKVRKVYATGSLSTQLEWDETGHWHLTVISPREGPVPEILRFGYDFQDLKSETNYRR